MILLRAKDVEFDVTYINLREKPDWFLEISPHGKVPVLKVGDEVLFESNAIAEYLDEVFEPRLHPADPVKRAKNRAWTDFLPTFAWGPALAMVPLGMLGTGLAFVALTTLVGRVGSSRGSISIYFTPLVAIVLGVAFRGERVTGAALAGTALVLVGAWLTSRREVRR